MLNLDDNAVIKAREIAAASSTGCSGNKYSPAPAIKGLETDKQSATFTSPNIFSKTPIHPAEGDALIS